MSLRPPRLLAQRHRQAEIMDFAELDTEDHMRALAGLGRINFFSRGAAPLRRALAGLVREVGGVPLRVLDLACGGGDVPIAIARWARRTGRKIEIHGCDISSRAIEYARKRAARRGVPVTFFQLDLLEGPLPDDYDVMTCSLFLHHLDEPDAIELLRQMAAAARRCVLVDDLIRSVRGYALALIGCRVLSRSWVVHQDGPISVGGAFTTDEALHLARQAGLEGATLRCHWPQRYLLSWGPA
jgi:2-polyprenyl-3-methyl-5-hydroxy-6-metoxy-1,4-benzoquinol methylase